MKRNLRDLAALALLLIVACFAASPAQAMTSNIAGGGPGGGPHFSSWDTPMEVPYR